jgi:acyl-coenzyme A synthetase/AMP-(fatty) acid ligase
MTLPEPLGSLAEVTERRCVDPDGYLHVVGRANDVIVTAAGEKVAPDDIELAYRSPLFAEVCAVGKGDEGAAQKPHLVVVPCPQRRPSFTEIQAEFVRLSRAAGPHRALGLTISTEPLPRTRTLKVRRHLVRERIWTPTSSAIGTA